ncbi:hypothetical protein CN151_00920 [Sinorhizobium meliloti]|nr:hypothetical protein [Sinorhizobium meliloti]RVL08645.1 hypothetical protein CN151_00920 [Sinorhizobium meliloti]RVM84725.1 hypothetical protein CN119_31950 [Sinorhizobium meliloti]RVN11755.1 hypothetical protein CN112_09925 [Sinorhizobium meliloti]
MRAFRAPVWKSAHSRTEPGDILIPVLVTGIQPDQALGLKELLPRRRRGAALISVTSTEMRVRRDCSPPCPGSQ